MLFFTEYLLRITMGFFIYFVQFLLEYEFFSISCCQILFSEFTTAVTRESVIFGL